MESPAEHALQLDPHVQSPHDLIEAWCRAYVDTGQCEKDWEMLAVTAAKKLSEWTMGGGLGHGFARSLTTEPVEL